MLMEERVGEPAYRIVDVNASNLDEFGMLCLKSKKNTEGYKDKVKWIKERFEEGLRLKLLLVKERRGRLKKSCFTSRGFIEYIPGEFTWRGIDAEGYMVIHCLWVVGRNRRQGYGTKLLEECIKDAGGMKGVAVVTTNRTWLPKKDIFAKHGFERADTMPPELELYVKRFSDSALPPRFNPIPKKRLENCGAGITIFKSDQCPYTNASTRAVSEACEQLMIPVQIRHVESCKGAQHSVHPYGTFCILNSGKVLTYHPIGKKDLLECLPKQN